MYDLLTRCRISMCQGLGPKNTMKFRKSTTSLSSLRTSNVGKQESTAQVCAQALQSQQQQQKETYKKRVVSSPVFCRVFTSALESKSRRLSSLRASGPRSRPAQLAGRSKARPGRAASLQKLNLERWAQPLGDLNFHQRALRSENKQWFRDLRPWNLNFVN